MPQRRPTPPPRALLPLLAVLAIAPVAAQSFGDRLGRTVQRAVEGEVQRKVDQETREATRCALGDERCAREAQREGREVVDVESGTAAPTGSSARAGTAAGLPALADDPQADHPRLSRYAGSEWIEGSNLAFDAYTLIAGRGAAGFRTEALEGRVTRRVYRNPGGRSTLEILRNYQQALEAQGFRLLWTCERREACGSSDFRATNGMNVGVAGDLRYLAARQVAGGATTTVAVAVNPQRSFVDVVETAAMDTGMVSAEALGDGLDASGAVVLEGLYFATGSADLLPASDAAIAAAATLLQARPDLRLDIQGHTDNVGNDATNLTLSRRRAQAVADALVKSHGIDRARLGVRGFGASRPVADNATDAGRAQNRRVELVRR
ncbi:OmpA family protein [Silanimonas sp.]|jgi:outer membrane protein OmpA-like peptidoglycan-associated protein|uniref:OmpA family protein n=1 Tax=Silanimonas sp. TaxID=1929290 RepID=UPI0022C034D9|nr:OmpA family protein [Silanimonas sp.]MCZ8114571.1 OmpA family protein [Silanimonas sp.]